jgi:hypothetical protein
MLAHIFLAGCVSTRPASSEEDFLLLTHRGLTHTARVTLSNGHVMKVRYLEVAADSASWRRVQDGRFQRVPIHDLREVRYRKVNGIRNALAIGLLVGAAAGANIQAPRSSCNGFGPCFHPSKEMIVAMSVITAGLTGLLIGANSGDRYIIAPGGSASPFLEEQARRALTNP